MSHRQDTPNYYRPYDSEDDTDTDTDEDYDDSSLPDSEDARIRREQDPRYAIIRTAGPNFNTSEQQLKYMENAPGASYDNNTNITTLQNLVYLNPPKTTITSLFSIKATNRDRKLFPSPFNFEIKLPRVYKNVTKFQLVQLSFPNNTVEQIVSSGIFISSVTELLLFRGVPQECISTCISLLDGGTISNTLGVVEEGRTNLRGDPIMTTLSLPDGSYTNEKIARELTTQSNNTPPFNLISYSTFKEIFETTRDVSVLFNEPGDLFFSRLTNGQIYKHFTKDTIMNTYYTQKHLDSLPEITEKIAFNAYYYPVLKELVATNGSLPFLTLGSYSYSEVYDLVLKNFEGLNSDTYYDICVNNQSALEGFRQTLTFELHNINKYMWYYDAEQSQYKVTYTSLHTSIERDFQKNFDTLLNQNLLLNNLTPKSFTELKKQNQIQATVLKHLETHLSTKIGEYHLLSGYKYFGGEIHSTATSTLTFNDLHSDTDFTNMFNFTALFGNQFGTSPGIKFSFNNFANYHSTISSYYTLYNTTKSTITSINTLTYDEHHKYVSTKYSGIFPESYILNKSYNNNSPVGTTFLGNRYLYRPGMSVRAGETDCETICDEIIKNAVISWYGCLPVNQVIKSLSYNFGLTDFTLSTFSFTSTFFSIPQKTNNYFLQINNEQSFNNMDVAMNENYDITNETTGQVKLMYAKILTGGIGSGEIAQTVIQNPILFETPLGKLDKLNFKIYYDNDDLSPGWLVLPFEVGFNDWDATFQIDEEVGFADRNTGWGTNPTIDIPNNPSGLQYMALTSTNNPNNK